MYRFVQVSASRQVQTVSTVSAVSARPGTLSAQRAFRFRRQSKLAAGALEQGRPTSATKQNEPLTPKSATTCPQRSARPSPHPAPGRASFCDLAFEITEDPNDVLLSGDALVVAGMLVEQLRGAMRIEAKGKAKAGRPRIRWSEAVLQLLEEMKKDANRFPFIGPVVHPP